jgi:hypothetical protein
LSALRAFWVQRFHQREPGKKRNKMILVAHATASALDLARSMKSPSAAQVLLT